MGTLCLHGDWGAGGAVGAPEGQAEIPKVLNVQANPPWRVMGPSFLSLLMSCCVQIDENPVHDHQNLQSTSIQLINLTVLYSVLIYTEVFQERYYGVN